MHKLVGYCDRWSARPGERIRFMAGSAEGAAFDLRFVRHLCADPNPDGPGYREYPMPTALDGERPGRVQSARLGSCARAAGLAVAPEAGLSVGATIWPTTPGKGRQGIVAVIGRDWRIALLIGADGGVRAEVTSPDGATHAAEVPMPMQRRRWYDVAAVLDPAGVLRVAQRPRRPVGGVADGGDAETACSAALPEAASDVVLAALPEEGAPRDATRTDAHYNGKLERPTLWRRALGLDGVLAAQRGAVPRSETADLLACWDFAIGIPGSVASDVGPFRAHARLRGLPTRAMTGAGWTGEIHDWKSAPEQYAAIHFHDDDQGDLGWAESFALDVPADWPSGLYSAHIRNDAGEDRIPFVVRPRAPAADVVVLIPSFTYQVYGAFVRPGRGAEIRERASSWDALLETPDMNREFGLSTYNDHSDGSGVAIASMLRPMLDTRPRQISLIDPVPGGSGTGRICADSYILDWLDRAGIACDVVTDHDLHADGAALLAPYRVVIAAQHPEYYSLRMMQAMEDYLGAGGRLMYLGGNGFYWRAEPSEAEPHAIEVRRAEGGIRVWATEPGESYHAFGGGYGGLWRRIGRSAHRLVGNGFSVQGRHLGFPYRFTDAIQDSRVAFMREGLDLTPGQAFGEAGFMGGGAAGFELDSVDAHHGTPPNALVVAKGVVIHPDYGPVNEDMLVIRHPKRQEDWSCADMVFFETPAGGAVFSVGSMTYAGSLPTEGYGSTLTRLTTNVLRRFRDPKPF